MVIVHTFLLCSFVFVVKFILHEVRMNVFIFLLPVALESIIHQGKNKPPVLRVVLIISQNEVFTDRNGSFLLRRLLGFLSFVNVLLLLIIGNALLLLC